MKPNKYRYESAPGRGKRVSPMLATTEGKRPVRRDQLTLEERGEILSLHDVKALNRCCKRRGIRTGNLSAEYTEIDGVRFY